MLNGTGVRVFPHKALMSGYVGSHLRTVDSQLLDVSSFATLETIFIYTQ